MKESIMMYKLLFLCLIACAPSVDKEEPFSSWSEPDFKFPYVMDEPDKAFSLSGKLDEISGLSMHTDGKHLVAVQDENGLIFYIDKETGEIAEYFEFWKDGDYEGVEMVGDAIFAVKSSGTLYCIYQPGKESQEVIKHNSFLNGDNDIEGIAYDVGHNRLLLACKAKAGDGKAYKLTKAIYGFSLESQELDSLPVYTISLEEVHGYLNTDPAVRKVEKLWEFFTPDESEFGFSPSGLAIHPLTCDLYITSSVGKLLMVLSPEGQIRHIEKLKKKIHEQPEGICFDEKGGLYISNEGKGGTAKLYYFSMRTE